MWFLSPGGSRSQHGFQYSHFLVRMTLGYHHFLETSVLIDVHLLMSVLTLVDSKKLMQHAGFRMCDSQLSVKLHRNAGRDADLAWFSCTKPFELWRFWLEINPDPLAICYIAIEAMAIESSRVFTAITWWIFPWFSQSEW